LDDIRDILQLVTLQLEVFLHIVERLYVLFEPVTLGVHDEDDAVHAFEDELAGGVIMDLARDGVEVETGFKTVDRAELQGEEVKEQRSIRIGRERDHLPFDVVGEFLVDVEKVGRLAAQTAAVINDLAVDLATRVVDE
jgi:hypothetical protein